MTRFRWKAARTRVPLGEQAPEEAEVAAHALALQKAREIVSDHVERNGAFTEEETEAVGRAWHGR